LSIACRGRGTYDGFLAFELERRGADEVVALDIPGHEDWDWPAHVRAQGPEQLARLAGPEKGVGLRVARDALDSRVETVGISVYELSPERLGDFDVVVCGSLMLHLRDPLRALEGIRSVCGGNFMSVEQIDLALSVRHPRMPVSRLDGLGSRLQWWIPNLAGHRQMVSVAGFEIERTTRPFCEPFGPGHPARGFSLRNLPVRAARTLATGNMGVPHSAVLASPG
jgi:hypothetical protein